MAAIAGPALFWNIAIVVFQVAAKSGQTKGLILMDLYYVQLDNTGTSTLDVSIADLLAAVDPSDAACTFVQKCWKRIGRPLQTFILVRSSTGRVDTRWNVHVHMVPKATASRVMPPSSADWLAADFVQRWEEAVKARNWLRLSDLMEQAQGKIFDLVHGPAVTLQAVEADVGSFAVRRNCSGPVVASAGQQQPPHANPLERDHHDEKHKEDRPGADGIPY